MKFILIGLRSIIWSSILIETIYRSKKSDVCLVFSFFFNFKENKFYLIDFRWTYQIPKAIDCLLKIWVWKRIAVSSWQTVDLVIYLSASVFKVVVVGCFFFCKILFSHFHRCLFFWGQYQHGRLYREDLLEVSCSFLLFFSVIGASFLPLFVYDPCRHTVKKTSPAHRLWSQRFLSFRPAPPGRH